MELMRGLRAEWTKSGSGTTSRAAWAPATTSAMSW